MGAACGSDARSRNIQLVTKLNDDQDGVTYKPPGLRKKKRAMLKQGSCDAHVVICSEGHEMYGKVAREGLESIRQFSCSGVSACADCGHEKDVSEGYYACKQCNDILCIECARKKVGLPVVEGKEENPVQLLPGDIMMAWPENLPLKFDAHHAILVMGELNYEPDLQEDLQVGPGVEVWSCRTIESTGLETGADTKWAPAMSYFARDKHNGTAKLIANSPELGGGEEGHSISLLETPVPVKVILHPFRKEWGGPGVDDKVFMKSVRKAASGSKKWSLSTLAKALRNKAELNPNDYPSPQSKAALMKTLEASWDSKPICSSVPVMVWQRYLQKMYPDEEAADYILQYMPILCSHVTPSALTKITGQAGWVLSSNFEA